MDCWSLGLSVPKAQLVFSGEKLGVIKPMFPRVDYVGHSLHIPNIIYKIAIDKQQTKETFWYTNDGCCVDPGWAYDEPTGCQGSAC